MTASSSSNRLPFRVIDILKIVAAFCIVLHHFQMYALLASLTWSNTNATWDKWAVYFFGAYGLVIGSACSPRRGGIELLHPFLFGPASAGGGFRKRIALAVSVKPALIQTAES